MAPRGCVQDVRAVHALPSDEDLERHPRNVCGSERQVSGRWSVVVPIAKFWRCSDASEKARRFEAPPPLEGGVPVLAKRLKRSNSIVPATGCLSHSTARTVRDHVSAKRSALLLSQWLGKGSKPTFRLTNTHELV